MYLENKALTSLKCFFKSNYEIVCKAYRPLRANQLLEILLKRSD
jgi:hypothetical protein